MTDTNNSMAASIDATQVDKNNVTTIRSGAQHAPDGPPFPENGYWVRTESDPLGRAGVWERTWISQKDKQGKPQPSIAADHWICGPLAIVAVTHAIDDKQGDDRLQLKGMDDLGRWREWSMQIADLGKHNGEIPTQALLSHSISIDSDKDAGARLREYLLAVLRSDSMFYGTPPKRVLHAPIGWASSEMKTFVLPDITVGEDADRVVFNGGGDAATAGLYSAGGSREEWTNQVAAKAIGNPIMILAISAAFTGPLLRPTGTDGGGLNFVGESSKGKTSILAAAGSVSGPPRLQVRRWRGTDNGLEATAETANDGILILDEIGQADQRTLGQTIYMLANGTGKQRARRDGSARTVKEWVCMILSSGEKEIASALDDGRSNVDHTAGQAVRMLDIYVTDRAYGVWDDLHGSSDGAVMSDTIKAASAEHYGHAGRAFVEALLYAYKPSDLIKLLDKICAMREFEGVNGQELRAARRFALAGMAGEIAGEFCLTGWPRGAAIDAAIVGYKIWLAGRRAAGEGSHEDQQIVQRLRDFIEQHGDSRFQSLVKDGPFVHHRAGWWTIQGDERIYMFTNQGMQEALQLRGGDLLRAIDALKEKGIDITPAQKDKKKSMQKKIQRENHRVYLISTKKL